MNVSINLVYVPSFKHGFSLVQQRLFRIFLNTYGSSHVVKPKVGVSLSKETLIKHNKHWRT